MLPAPKAVTGAGNAIRTTQRARSIVPRDERKKAMILALVSGITDKDYQDIAVAKFATLCMPERNKTQISRGWVGGSHTFGFQPCGWRLGSYSCLLA
jgi:hypothetical protein